MSHGSTSGSPVPSPKSNFDAVFSLPHESSRAGRQKQAALTEADNEPLAPWQNAEALLHSTLRLFFGSHLARTKPALQGTAFDLDSRLPHHRNGSDTSNTSAAGTC